MLIEVKTPALSESVQSGTLLAWRKQVGEAVARDEVIAELETDKVILEIPAPVAGALSAIKVEAGAEAVAGQVLAEIDGSAVPAQPARKAAARPAPERVPGQATNSVTASPPPAAPAKRSAPPPTSTAHLPPSARRAQVAPDTVGEALPAALRVTAGSMTEETQAPGAGGPLRREPMSRLRQRIAERLKEAQNTAAILTTFNEIDMQPVLDLRRRHQERFQQEHGIKLGLMGFFVKAACQALRQFPVLNARVEGRDIVYQDFYDIGVAVSSERGLVVPVLRGADRLSFAGIEGGIADFARRANSLELSIDELTGGTFTISNGGVFGSLLSTPILNPPQSGVLGLHKIEERPVAQNGEVVIRPMMYVALSYDHRIIDGREAVSFLVALKTALEAPASLLLEL